MATKLLGPVKHKRGTTAGCAAYTGEAGELVLDMEAKKIYIHDGITQGGHEFGAGASNLLVWDVAVNDDLGMHNEDAEVSVSVRALSAFGNEQVTYRVTAGSLPAGLTINTATGMLTGRMPNLTTVTAFPFTLEATDSFNTISREFVITVNADNDSPVWQTPSDLGMLTGAVSKQLVATDPDGVLTYTVSGGSLPPGLSLSSGGMLSGTVIEDGQTYNFTVTVSDGVNHVQRTFSALAFHPAGEALFTNVGTHNWVVPAGVHRVSVVCIGGGGSGGNAGHHDQNQDSPPTRGAGGGAGGGLAWKNSIPVTPGQTISITVGEGALYPVDVISKGPSGGTSSFGIIFSATGGEGGDVNNDNVAQGGFPVGDYDEGGRGGNGGPRGTGNSGCGGGGGAGGYTGDGGDGGSGTGQVGTSGSGGGGGGGTGASYRGGGGGGVGVYGQGVNGAGSTYNSINDPGTAGKGGSGGTDGTPSIAHASGIGGTYGGGGAGQDYVRSNPSNPPNTRNGQGAVRIIWGTGRSFPYNAA